MTPGIQRPIILLTPDEARKAMFVGRLRHERGEAKGYRQSDGSRASNALLNHQRGAAAELAVSKYLGVPWDATVDGYQSVPDLPFMEIRGRTGRRPYLRVKKKDHPGKALREFVSVERCWRCRFMLDGWIYGMDAMKPQYLVPVDADSGMPEWHVPIADLRPMSALLYFWTQKACASGR